jgi:hypothetical protein
MAIDPRPAFTEGDVVTALAGVAGVAALVRELADTAGAPASRGPSTEPDDFVHLLLGLAGLGAAVERLAPVPSPRPDGTAAAQAAAPAEWLR